MQITIRNNKDTEKKTPNECPHCGAWLDTRRKDLGYCGKCFKSIYQDKEKQFKFGRV